jgi:hypothetical protein
VVAQAGKDEDGGCQGRAGPQKLFWGHGNFVNFVELLVELFVELIVELFVELVVELFVVLLRTRIGVAFPAV